MKKKIVIITWILLIMMFLTSCQSLSVSTNTVGKNNTTAKKMAAVIDEDIAGKDGKSDYTLYGIEMSMDTEGIGKAKLVYATVLPQDLQYSDISVVTVDTRTGKVDSVSDADFATMGVAPYEMIVDGAPLLMSEWKIDSSDARVIAESTFYGKADFVYNYVQISAMIFNQIRQYKVTFISFVNHQQYTCFVDGMTGALLSEEITEI